MSSPSSGWAVHCRGRNIYPKDQSQRYLCEKTNQTEYDLTTYSILIAIQTTEQTYTFAKMTTITRIFIKIQSW